ncbi:MAG: nucleotide pyrophosphohydrolase [Candidatus Kerfeldbacteria bacterium]|nr:nucleotide pyrophosphohydrolase [Candidatus Kerfeldbacteria bacterium]
MKQLCADIRTFLVERGWDGIRPSDIAKSISIEAGELLELFQWNDMTQEALKADGERMKKLPRELADILIYALEMCALLGLDAEVIVRDKLAYNSEKYPAKLMRERADKSGTSTDPYIQIKRSHRRKENA